MVCLKTWQFSALPNVKSLVRAPDEAQLLARLLSNPPAGAARDARRYPLTTSLFTVVTPPAPLESSCPRPAPSLPAQVGPRTLVMPTQNGIDTPEMLAAVVGEQHVVRPTADSAAPLY